MIYLPLVPTENEETTAKITVSPLVLESLQWTRSDDIGGWARDTQAAFPTLLGAFVLILAAFTVTMIPQEVVRDISNG